MTDIFVAPKKNPIAALDNKVLKTKIPLVEEKPAVFQKNLIKTVDPYSLKKKMGLLSSFGVRPYGVSFGEQGEDEEIFLFLRRHIVTNIPWLVTGLFFLLLPIFLFLIFDSSPLPFTTPMNFIVIFLLFYYLIIITFLFINYTGWFFNIALVTDKRVVDLNYSDVIYHNMAVTKLNLIEDINYVQAGFMRSFFDYGDIFIQTAGEKLNFHFMAVPKPARATEIIQNLMGGDKDVWS
ncbi:MAG: hypothetical protein COY68_00810 [Candidatus Levybacteria bacterium CG_4_10_14_0_8_um_filter_35_23]|nr:MAG: hypothetical protein COY68_00810 [Candidatus Levybacteria bacterium CG_4_10_14_0_8_um_filter_35_23]